jgi:hypothetical protein
MTLSAPNSDLKLKQILQGKSNFLIWEFLMVNMLKSYKLWDEEKETPTSSQTALHAINYSI